MGNNFIFNKSFQLLRTNPLLTTNIQVVVNSNYNLYLESFNTNKSLNDDKYKHSLMNKESYFENKIPLFYDGLPPNIIFDVKYDDDQDVMYNEYSQQFDEMYWAGASNIKDQWHSEEYEYLAPLYIKKDNLPTNFIILRVNDAAVFNQENQDFLLNSLSKDNFRSEIIDKWICVNNFDLTYQSDFGYWLNRNYVTNDRFPLYPFELDVKEYNFSRWYGIDTLSGVYNEKDLYLKDKLYYENPHFNLESFISNGWRTNELIYPNILNIKFLFDDTPATPFDYKTYSINRYYGFYTENMELVKNVTSYRQPELKTNLKLQNNIFMNINDITGSTNPFVSVSDYWTENYWVYAKNDLYKVYHQTITNPNGSSYEQYGIICDFNLSISDFNRDNEIDINFIQDTVDKSIYTNSISGRTSNFTVDQYYDDNGISEMYNDLYLIKIDNKYHILKSTNSSNGFDYYIQTDYGIKSTSDQLKYWIINEETNSKIINMSDVLINDIKPTIYQIYKVTFSDIRDFDFDRVNTKYANFDFEIDADTYTVTPEQKLYTTEHLDDSYPKAFKVYPIGDVNEGKVVNVSSEYISTDELFEINQFGLSDIWRKNSSVCKWGFAGSNSHSDYPYKLNNSNKVGSTFNRTTNPFSLSSDAINKNLDYFYRIGNLYNGLQTDVKNYLNQTIYIETETYDDSSKKFNLDYYLSGDLDYFDYFFKNTRCYDIDKNIEQTTKYSIFVGGDNYNNSYTLFKGIKYNLRKVSDMNRTNGKISDIIISDSNYNDYKFSVIINYNYSGTTTSDVIDTKNVLSNSNGINVFLNEKYKNALIIINYTISATTTNINLNDTSLFDERNGYYTGIDINGNLLFNKYYPVLLCATNFINCINNVNDKSGFDRYVNYVYIDSNGYSGYTLMGTDSLQFTIDNNMSAVPSLTKTISPFIIDAEYPIEMKLKKNSYTTVPIKGPKYNIYDKYKIDYKESPYNKSNIIDPIARVININEKEIKPKPVEHGETLVYDKQIFRFNGPYEPIFKEVELFDKTKYFISTDGYFTQNGYTTNVNQVGSGISWDSNSFVNIKGPCDDSGMLCNFTTITAPRYTNELIVDNFGFSIPLTANIISLKIDIRQKTSVCNTYSNIYCSQMKLNVGGIDIGNNMSSSSYFSHTYGTLSPTLQTKMCVETGNYTMYSYSAETTNFGYSLTPSIINNTTFGLGIMYQNDIIGTTNYNTLEIDCVNVDVTYNLPNISTGTTFFASFNRNLKFNTDLSRFGLIDELVYSKVNHIENVLKIKNTEEDLSIYPMIDEFGYTYSSRFIFKSTFDKDYYIQTLNTLK